MCFLFSRGGSYLKKKKNEEEGTSSHHKEEHCLPGLLLEMEEENPGLLEKQKQAPTKRAVIYLFTTADFLQVIN